MVASVKEYLRERFMPHIWCPGCGHGIIMNNLIRAIASLGIKKNDIVMVTGIGCSSRISGYLDFHTLHTLHGRALPFATGAKMFNPELKVIVVSGDGDLTSIGGNHLIHAARRNTPLTVICANNMIYGMTGGQVASTSPVGALTATTMEGNVYKPFDLCKLVLGAGAPYVARYSVTQPLSLIGAVKKALSMPSFAFLDALSPCPTQFGRRNRYDSPADMLRVLMESCVSREEAAKMSREALEGKIVTGEFSNEEG